MACSLTTGRQLPCKESVGGLSKVYFADYGTLGTATIAAGNISALSGTPSFFEYDLKGATSSLTTNIISSRDTGTTVYESTLELTFTHLDVATQEEIKGHVDEVNRELDETENNVAVLRQQIKVLSDILSPDNLAAEHKRKGQVQEQIKKLQEEVTTLQHMHNGRHPFIDELSSSHHTSHLPVQKTKSI